MADPRDRPHDIPPFPAVIVRRPADAEAALGAAERAGCGVTLLSDAGASATLGVGGFEALAASARQCHPDVPAVAMIDCADRPGDALAALRQGLRWIVCRVNGPARAALAGLAAAQGARVLVARPPALDLDRIGSDRSELDRWLRVHSP